ncbi:hypothetical protein B0T19DRAFT_22026 [Cercophora scortea]|uniref:Uncharacterized protein n=1 Tax=Cercophora scortea TaxID=314031 RepID=A0AAE0J3J1_9PEZI|nr:hypothetical protein B0T19DRAFT_22026 [Cercophora scortea]
MKFRVLLQSLALPFVSGVPLEFRSTAGVPTGLPADQISINSVSTYGTGCPTTDSVSITLADNNTVLTVGFNDFQTFVGPDIASSQSDKTCSISLNVYYPGGYTSAYLNATYHGFAELDAGVSGNISSLYSFPGTIGSGAFSSTNTNINTGGVYLKADHIPLVSKVTSPCGRNATAVIRVRVKIGGSNSTLSGTLTDDDVSLVLTQQVHSGKTVCK